MIKIFWNKEFLPRFLPKRDHPRAVKQPPARGGWNPSSAARKKELLTHQITYNDGEHEQQAQQVNMLGSSLLIQIKTLLCDENPMPQQLWNERPRLLVPGQGGRKIFTVERFGIELATMVKSWRKNHWPMPKQQTIWWQHFCIMHSGWAHEV